MELRRRASVHLPASLSAQLLQRARRSSSTSPRHLRHHRQYPLLELAFRYSTDTIPMATVPRLPILESSTCVAWIILEALLALPRPASLSVITERYQASRPIR